MQIRSMGMRPFAIQKPNSFPANALVIYGKRPYEQVMDMAPDGNSGRQVISRYTHDLFIDLWLVKLKFEWRGKRSAEAKKILAREARERMDSEPTAPGSGAN